jgi:hypothetical protein
VVLNGQKKNGNHKGFEDTSIHPCPCKVYEYYGSMLTSSGSPWERTNPK